MKTIKETLQLKGIKPTFQRLKIIKYLKENKIHPTVDMIYRALVKEIPTMSKTTVYNTLKMMADKQMVSMVTITGTEVRFDDMTNGHHHFLCEKCGKVIDIDVTCPVSCNKELDGHKIKEVHGYFKGICANCRK